jgi:hypothetical protein
MSEQKIKIEFAPGCFDDFEGTQEELDELISQITQMVEDESILENSKPMTEEDFDELPVEIQESIMRDLDQIINGQDREKKLN